MTSIVDIKLTSTVGIKFMSYIDICLTIQFDVAKPDVCTWNKYKLNEQNLLDGLNSETLSGQFFIILQYIDSIVFNGIHTKKTLYKTI